MLAYSMIGRDFHLCGAGTNPGSMSRIFKVNRGLRDEIKIFYIQLYINPYSAGMDFRRQNLMSTDVKFCHLMSITAM